MRSASVRSKKRPVSMNRRRKSAVSEDDGLPTDNFDDFYAPHITDPDPSQKMMSKAEMERAARNVFKANPELARK